VTHHDDDVSGVAAGSVWRSGASALVGVVRRRPHDLLAAAAGLAGLTGIVVNALFLQAGPHPSPMFYTRPPLSMSASREATTGALSVLPRPRPSEATIGPRGEPAGLIKPGVKSKPLAANLPPSSPPAQPAAAPAPRPDPIAAVIAPSARLTAIQRALAKSGFGQVKITGVYDPETRAAIERFEADRGLPVTGQVSDRLVRVLNSYLDRPVE
jgi:hypothetical protein